MKRKLLVINLTLVFIFAFIFPKIVPINCSPYSMYNDGVGFGPLPIEVGMSGEIVGGYRLEYDIATENGCAIFVIRNVTTTILQNIFYEQSTYIERHIPIVINPEEWSPGQTGQLTFVDLNLVMETDQGIFYDNSSVWFYIQRASPLCSIENFTVSDQNIIVFFKLYNENNPIFKAKDILINIQILLDGNLILEKVSKTDFNGLFSISIPAEFQGSNYSFKIITLENEDYISGNFEFGLSINNSENIHINSSIESYTFFEEDTDNKIKVEVTDDYSENYIAYFLNQTYPLDKDENSFFYLELQPPLSPGLYPLILKSINQTSINNILLPIIVKSREAQITTEILAPAIKEGDSISIKIKIVDSLTGKTVKTGSMINLELLQDNNWLLIENKSLINEFTVFDYTIINIPLSNSLNFKVTFQDERYSFTEKNIQLNIFQEDGNFIILPIMISGIITALGSIFISFKRIRRKKDLEII